MGFYVYPLILYHLMLILSSSLHVLAQVHFPSDHHHHNLQERKIRNLQSDNSSAPANDETQKKSSSFRATTTFLLFDFVALAAVLILFFLYYKKAKRLKKLEKMMMKKKKKKKYNIEEAQDGDEDDTDYEELEDEEEDQVRIQKRVQLVSADRSRLGITVSKDHADHHDQKSRLISSAAAERRLVSVSKNGSDQDQRENMLVFMRNNESTGRFELNDLLKASAEGLGKGIFGNSYKAKLDGKSAVVVKRLRDLRPLSNEEFINQIEIMSEFNHPNLLPLLAYYNSKDEKLLLHKYAEKGNLFNRLHGGRGTSDRNPLKWNSRLSVARGVARALEYLHQNAVSRNTVVLPHGNLKLSNVLLDENELVLVSDYGFSSLLALPIAAQRMVSYKSPEYQAMKKISRKSDVWSYGSFLLELLTGRISVYTAPPGINGVDLCSWVHRAVREEWTAEIFDVEISVERSAAQGMVRLLQVAIRCCDRSPEKRPEMAEVVREVENIQVGIESEDEESSSIPSLTDESVSTGASGSIGCATGSQKN